MLHFKTSEAPFWHSIADKFLGPETIAKIHSEWPIEGWQDHNHGHSEKRGNPNWDTFGPDTTSLLRSLNGYSFLNLLRLHTNIEDLSADDTLAGGGLHETGCGGFLDIHADFNRHPDSKLYRRLNLLIFLNTEWKDEWNGHLELWDRNKQGCQVRIAPIGGRCVIFETAPDSFHGHPAPLACPEGVSRRSIALYYYSAEPGRQISEAHSTLYLGEEEAWPNDARQRVA